MKKFFTAIWIICVFFCACSKQKSDGNQAVNDGHNSRDSLDWAGVYSGLVPAKGGQKLIIKIELKYDNSYALFYKDSENGEAFTEQTGVFSWTEDGGTIKLDIDSDISPYYKVIENAVIQLDRDGGPLKGHETESYVLRRQRDQA
ncbi:MAG: copper resistance protein NlpE [Spirochaetaceae bacterium]|jgi:hypothetical protein|nr:copper resistance protein NlpE [Spirochaetaceae bacterium]